MLNLPVTMETHMQSPIQFYNQPMYYPVNHQQLVYAGYDYCAEEAIRYLVEIEGLPVHHPMVQGLREHINNQRQMLNVPQLIHNSINSNISQTVPPTCKHTVENVELGSTGPLPSFVPESGVIPKSEVDNISDGVMKVLQGNNPEAISVAEELLSLLQEERMSLEDVFDEYSDDSEMEELDDDDTEQSISESEP